MSGYAKYSQPDTRTELQKRVAREVKLRLPAKLAASKPRRDERPHYFRMTGGRKYL